MGRIEDAHHIICYMICYSFMEHPDLAQPESGTDLLVHGSIMGKYEPRRLHGN